jgi:hypothetical protein
MNWHLIWLWFWFFAGSFVYWIKRAYFMINPPNPVAHSLGQFVERAWMPLLFRFAADSGIYWATFSPAVLSAALHAWGWDRFASSVDAVTQYGFFALFFGMGVDSAVDIGVTKIPWIKDFWPQMPGPLPSAGTVTVTATKETLSVAVEPPTPAPPKEN